MEATDPTPDAMRRYQVVAVDHSGGESEFVALTSGGMTKAAYMAGSAFDAMHPRTSIATFRIVEATGKRRDTDLVERMEW